MSATAALAFVLVQAAPSSDFDVMMRGWKRNGFAEASSKRLSPGPHTLLITHVRGQFTRFDYRSGPACQKARDQMMAQYPKGAMLPFTAVCVPR